MTANINRLEIRDRARRRLNAVDGTFWTDTELDPEINASGQEWHELVTGAWGEGFFEKFEEFTTAASAETYTQSQFTNTNNDFLTMRAVGIKDANGEWTDLPRFTGPREYFVLANSGIRGRIEHTHWDLIDDILYLLPIPDNGRTIRVWYQPTFTVFTDDVTNIDAVHGWADYIIADICRKYRISEDRSSAPFDRELAVLRERITTRTNKRKAGRPARIVVTRSTGIRAYRTV